jgi:hypothetical protein
MRAFPLEPLDARGRRIRTGDVVRVIGVPDLSTMHESARRQSAPVFRHILGTCKRVNGFDPNGFADLFFRIRSGRHSGLHSVVIEPELLLRQKGRERA